MEEESSGVVKMDKEVLVTAVSEGSTDFVRIKQEVDLPEDDTYYPMDFGISVEDEEEMNPVYVKMRSKEPGSSGMSQGRDGAKPYEEEEDSEESGEESREESDEESSYSGERTGEEDGDQEWMDNRGIRDEEIEQPSTSEPTSAPIIADMIPVVIKDEPLSDDEGPGLSYEEDPDQFAESYKMLESLRRASEREETGQSSRGALFDSKSSLSKIDSDGMKQEQKEVIIRCGICSDVFDFQSDLDAHQKVLHNAVNDSYSVVVDGRERGISKENVAGDLRSPISRVVRVEITKEYYQELIEDETFDFQNEMDPCQELPHAREPGILSDSQSGPFEYGTCRLCKKACGNRRMYLMHLRTKHSEELPYECQVCKARYLDEEDLESYNRKRIGQIESGSKEENTCELCGDKTSYACHTCNMEFENRPKLIVHSAKIHCKGKHCYCHLCEKYFPDTRQTREHLETHYPVPLKAIEKSPLVQEIKSDLDTKGGNQPQEAFHQKIHLPGESQTSSENAAAVGSSPEQLPRHHCIYCKEEFQSLQTLLHVDHACVHINSTTKRCPLCSKQVGSRKKFRQHMVSHNLTCKTRHKNQPANRMMDISQVKSLGQTCRCEWCKKEFDDRNKLIDHTRIHFAQGRNQCPVCERWYTNTTYFRQHVRVHGIILSDKDRQYNIQQAGPSKKQHCSCLWCDKKFQSSDKLAAHTYLHIARGRNCCPVCGKWVGRRKQSVFRAHLLSHGIKTLRDDKRQFGKPSGKGSLATPGVKQEVESVVDGLTQSGGQGEKSSRVPTHRCAWCHLGFHDLETLGNHTHDHIHSGMNRCPVCCLSFSGVWGFKLHLSVHGIPAPYKKKVFTVPGTSIGLPLPQVDKARVMNMQNSEGQDDVLSLERTPLSSHTQTLADSLTSGTLPCISNSDQGPPHPDENVQAILATVSIAASQVQTSCRLPEHCCQWCGREFDGLEELVAHTRIHIKDGKNQCPVCKKWLSNKSNFKQHLKRHGIISPFENKSVSIEHIRSNSMFISQMGKQRKSSTSIKKSYLSRKSSKHKTSLSIGSSDLKSLRSAHKRHLIDHPSSASSHSQQDEMSLDLKSLRSAHKRQLIDHPSSASSHSQRDEMSLDLKSDRSLHSSGDSLESSTTKERSTGGTVELSQNHTCDVCKIEFSSAQSLSKHHCLPNFKLGIYCPLCPKWLKSKLTLQWHMTLAHPNEDKLLDVDKEFLGPLDVDTKFLFPRGLKEGQLQQQVDTLSCEICSKSFVHHSEYITHKKLHIATSTSGASSASRTSDQVERKLPPSVDPQTVSENRCDLEIADQKEKLSRTSNQVQQKLPPSVDPQTVSENRCDLEIADEEKKLCCVWCQKQFHDANELVDHTNVHYTWGSNCCPVCKKWFTFRYFKQHLKLVHGIIPSTKLRQYDVSAATTSPQEMQSRCKWCDESFDSIDSLGHHTRLHIVKGKNRCPFCGKWFATFQKSHFRVHLRKHGVIIPSDKAWILDDTSGESPVSQIDLKDEEVHCAKGQNDDISCRRLHLAKDTWTTKEKIKAENPHGDRRCDEVQQISDERGHSNSSESHVPHVLPVGQQQQNLASQRSFKRKQNVQITSDEMSGSQLSQKGMKKQTAGLGKNDDFALTLYWVNGTPILTGSPVTVVTTSYQAQQNLVKERQSSLGTSSDASASQGQKKEVEQQSNQCHIDHISHSQRSQHLAPDTQALTESPEPANQPIHRCLWCVQEFSSLDELNVHLQSHIVKGKNLCPVCKKWLCNEYYFKTHLQLHGFKIEKQRKIKSLKKKSESNQITKRQIIFRRAPVRGQRHRCPWCTKDFVTLVKLVDHTRVHISKRKNHCPVCKKLFTDRSLFGEHLKIHGIIPPPEKNLWSILDIDSNMTNPQVAHAEVKNKDTECLVVLDERLHSYSFDMPTLMDSPLSGTPSNDRTSDQVQHGKESQCVVDATTGDTVYEIESD